MPFQHATEAPTAFNGFAVAALVTFVIAYALVVLEDLLHLRKSKPVVLAAGVMWVLTACAVPSGTMLEEHVLHDVGEFGALFLFLLVAMTYISAISERNVFLAINAWLVSRGWGFRAIFWITGLLAFCMSPVADNLTTALVLGTVAITVGRGHNKFIVIACTNIVVAANAGGAFSPFGDVTTLLVWAEGKVPFSGFFAILLPSVVNWLVPAVCMHFALPKEKPKQISEAVQLKPGWLTVCVLFVLTIALAVVFHGVLHLPPFLGMTTGLAGFFFYVHFVRRAHVRRSETPEVDALKNVAEVEWDTMLFFFGVILCVGALRELGYLALASQGLYTHLGPTWANIGVGVASAVIDNVPVMFAVLGMDPVMGTDPETIRAQWLLITLTAGVGGSLLSVGSAAGVGLMGVAHGRYTFAGHLKWTPVIALGYVASILCHMYLHPELLER
ncbi:MAG: sodium:proton antiporter NhaD [Planctomycetota bacterium]